MMAAAALAVIGALVLGLALGFALADGRRAQRETDLAIAENAARAMLVTLRELAEWLEANGYATEAAATHAVWRDWAWVFRAEHLNPRGVGHGVGKDG